MTVHLYFCKLDSAQKFITKYWTKYKRPIWVTEFACGGLGSDEGLPNSFLRCAGGKGGMGPCYQLDGALSKVAAERRPAAQAAGPCPVQ